MVCEVNGTRCIPGSHRYRSSTARLPMPHVAHLTTVHHPQDPRIFHKQCKTLRDAGYDVHLVAQRETSATVDGMCIHALPVVEGRRARLRLQPLMYRTARSIPAAVYHIHDPELIPLLWLLKRTTGAAVIYDMHEDYRGHGPVQGRMLRALERWAFQWVDHVVYANAAHRDIVGSASVPATRIPNYPIVPEQQADQPRAIPKRVLYTGVIADQGGRGLSNLIALAHHLHRASSDWQMRLAGVCYVEADRIRAEQAIARHGLDAMVERIGWTTYVPRAQMQVHYRASDVGLVLATSHPNMETKVPTKFYEYLQHGLPIVCSDFPLWRSFIERHGCGAVVPPGDAGAAAQVLYRWRTEPSRYQLCAEAARQAASQFRWRRVEPVLQSVYQRVC